MKLSQFKIQSGVTQDEEYFLETFQGQHFLLEVSSGDPELFILKVEGNVRGAFLGRGDTCQLKLAHDQVSTLHAQLAEPRDRDGSWHLVDLNSTNGTYIGGERLAPGVPSALYEEAVVRFGKKARFRFLSAKNLRTRLKRRSRKDPVPTFLCSDLFNPIRLSFDHPISVGRSCTSTIVLPHQEVSRNHCEIERRPEGLFLTDLGSRNGTLVGERLVEGSSTELEPGDRISVGPFDFVVRGPQELEAEGVDQETLNNTTLTIQGNLDDLPLVDVLQSILDKEQSGILEVQGVDGSEGRIRFENGVVCDAYTSAGLNGTIAIRGLMREREGTFVLHQQSDGWSDPVTRRETSLESLLIEEVFGADALEEAFHG